MICRQFNITNVFIIFRTMDNMKDLTEKLKETKTNSSEAELLAEDSLASIDARADLIKKSTVTAKKLLDDSTSIKLCKTCTLITQ